MKRLFVCLAAGKGTRMGRLSAYLQKCMYPIDGIPFVEYTLREISTLEAVQDADAEVLFVVGHLGEQLEAYFGAEYGGMQLSYVRQEKQLGTAQAVFAGLQARPGTHSVVVWLADSFFSAVNFQRLMECPYDHAVTLLPADHGQALHHRVEVTGTRVTRSWHGTGPYIEGGLWKLERRVLSEMPAGSDGEYRMLHALQTFIQRGGQVGYIEGTNRVHLSGHEGIDDAELRRAIRTTAAQGGAF